VRIFPRSDSKTFSGIAPSIYLAHFNLRAELLPKLRISVTTVTLIYQSKRGVALGLLEFNVVLKWHFHQQKMQRLIYNR